MIRARAVRAVGISLAAVGAILPIGSGGSSYASPRAGGTQLWATRYDGPRHIYDQPWAIAVSPDGSAVFATGSSGGDYATVAYDPATGTIQWGARYNGPGDRRDTAYSVAVSPDGSTVFVTGASQGTSSSDYGTVAYDAGTGSMLWVARYDGPAHTFDEANSVMVSPDGSRVFVTGKSDGVIASNYGTVAYDAATGGLLWAKRYNGPGNADDEALSVRVSLDGSMIFVTGYSDGGISSYDYATVAYDAATGALRWAKRYNGPADGADYTSSLDISPDGARIFVTGSSVGPSSSPDFATVAYASATGARLWVRRYNGPGNGDDESRSIAGSPDGAAVFVTGWSAGASGRLDYETIAYDSATGMGLWAARYDGPIGGDDLPASVAANGSEVFVTGSSPGTTGGYEFTTLAHDSLTGNITWEARYDGPVAGDDWADSIAVSPDGSAAYVTGFSPGGQTSYDYATVAYEA